MLPEPLTANDVQYDTNLRQFFLLCRGGQKAAKRNGGRNHPCRLKEITSFHTIYVFFEMNNRKSTWKLWISGHVK
jgi:hypothetical protein